MSLKKTYFSEIAEQIVSVILLSQSDNFSTKAFITMTEDHRNGW